MDENFFDRYKLPIGLSLVGLILIIGGIFTSGLTKFKPKDFPKESIVQPEDKQISVDVSGAVVTPGVYRLKEGARIEDAIAKAGGFSDLANKEYIAKVLNMAQKLVDGSKVYIPFEGDSIQQGFLTPGGSPAGAAIQSKVNINTSPQSDLETLSAVGPVTASKIISGRPYSSIDELLSKKVVSKAVFEKIKDQVVIY